MLKSGNGLLKSAPAMVKKAVFYVMNSIGSLSKLHNGSSGPALKTLMPIAEYYFKLIGLCYRAVDRVIFLQA